MLLGEATKNHPFNHAYPVENLRDVRMIPELFDWICAVYVTTAYPMPPIPPVMVVNHDHLQEAAQRANHQTTFRGDVFGWYSQQYQTVFISDRTKISKNKQHAATLIHEFVHYLQDMLGVENDVAFLEQEADKYTQLFIQNA